jgi:hypothetical protein
LGQAANKECPRIALEEAKTLQNETGSSYRKQEVLECVKCFTNPLEQRKEISSIRVFRISKKEYSGNALQEKVVDISYLCFIISLEYCSFFPQLALAVTEYYRLIS